jgi:hypothetical protein
MCITLRIASIVSIFATIFAAFLTFANVYNGDYILAAYCLVLCGIGVMLWRFANTADEEYNH